ncbi:hypothetical protein Clacol_002734 [Clathrus columnatus]|uniref:Protein PNS1 n=1 Tax=Clathrus columnatus TaxID=1419009 RepID=A0AAV5A682_9AGAM|nr:hypothetical protein Clacol_002734 [Clathrus columnatus]
MFIVRIFTKLVYVPIIGLRDFFQETAGAIIFTIVAVFSLLAYFGYRARIPLAALFFQVIIDVVKSDPSVYTVAFTAMFLHSGLSVWLTFTVVATYLWTSQVIGNVALATLAGGPRKISKYPTISSFIRASTYSLGSIAFGSLLVAFLECLRFILSAIRNGGDSQGHPVEICLICCTDCCLGLVESIFQYFNRYAYIEVALYGKSFPAAARDTWHLLKDRGIDALINDSLVGITLTWGAYLVGLLTSLFGYLYLRLTHPAYNTNGQYTAPVVLISFIIGLTSSSLEAGVSTIFVGIADHPELLALRSPALFNIKL